MKAYLRFPCATLLLVASSFSLQAQTCHPNIRATAPTSRYTVNTNGTVLDKRTGLMWKRCAEGLSGTGCSTGFPTYTDWGGALNLATGSAFAGYRDWRVPNHKELMSLVEDKCYGPAINLSVFPGMPNWYWSSSPHADIANGAWIVGFDYGEPYINTRDTSRTVRLVRGGQ